MTIRSFSLKLVRSRLSRVFIIATLGLMVASCSGEKEQSSNRKAPIRVLTTSPTLAALVTEIGGPYVSVISLNQHQQNPFETTVTNDGIIKLMGAQLFVHAGFNPKGEEKVVARFKAAIETRSGKVLDLSTSADALSKTGSEQQLPWLRPGGVEEIGRQITDRLSKLDPRNATKFEYHMTDLRSAILAIKPSANPTPGLPVDEVISAHKNPLLVLHPSWMPLAQMKGFEERDLKIVTAEQLTKGDFFPDMIAALKEHYPIQVIAPSWVKVSGGWELLGQVPACWEIKDRDECYSIKELVETNSRVLVPVGSRR